jgi:hypothetical protein
LNSEVAGFATSESQDGAFCHLETKTDENEKGKRKCSRNKSATGRMKKYSRKPQRIGEFRRGY